MTDSLARRIKYSPLSRVATLPMRARMSLLPALRHTAHVAAWTLRSREWADVPYNYQPIGVQSMAATLALITGVPRARIAAFADELLADPVYVQRHRERVLNTRLRHISDPELRYSRGLYYYMLVRAAKTRLAFEAGTDKGYSSFAICRALARNAAEDGVQGHLVTVDIKDDRGDMLDGGEGGLVTRLVGDSIAILRGFDRPIDFFMHDTMNEPQHTRDQLAALQPRLAPRALVHTAWFNETYVEFCDRAGLTFLEVVDNPADTWYPGDRYGLAWRPEAWRATR